MTKTKAIYKYPPCVDNVEIYPNLGSNDPSCGNCEEHNHGDVCEGNNSKAKKQPCKFNPKCIGRNCKGVRFWLEVTLKNRPNNTMVVILKNPSKATTSVCDRTIQNVINYLCNKKKYIGKIIILNLMPIYETVAKNVKKHHICPLNLECIDCITKRHKDVIIAWGNNTTGMTNGDYHFLTKDVIDKLKRNKCTLYHVGKCNASGHPKHGMRWNCKDRVTNIK